MNDLALPGVCTSGPTPLSLKQLIQLYSAPLGAFLARLGVARCDIDDVRQRIWLTVSRCLENVHAGSERAFLWTVARREAGHARRTHRRRAEVTLAEFDDFAAAALAGDEWLHRTQQLQRSRAVLQQLDVSLRVVLLLVELDGASARDVAQRLGIPVGTVKSRLRRARADCARRGNWCSAASDRATAPARHRVDATSPADREEPRRATLGPGIAARSAVG
jgi:RNA polymerase sigma-70 factor, ECF subfamily